MRRCTRIRERTRPTKSNIDGFVRRFVKGIHPDELTTIPNGAYSSSFVFQYGTDKILKINKVGARMALLKEASLQSYLSDQDLPVHVPAPVEVHSRGFYSIYPKLSGESLTGEVVSRFSSEEMEVWGRSIGEFLSYLHGTDFPGDLSRTVPRGEKDLESMRAIAKRWVDFIDQHASSPETGRFREQLETFRGAFTQRWAINHGDLSLGNIMRLEGDPPRFAIIDFTDAEECDPSMEFFILRDDLTHEGLDELRILGSVLRHYELNGDDFGRKLEFRALLGEIQSLFRTVRADVRREKRAVPTRNLGSAQV